MPTSGSPPVRRRRLGAELRRLREGSGQTAEAVGTILGWSKAKVSRYELAQSGLKPSDVERLLDVYGVDGEHRQRLLTLAEEATQKGWWEDFSDVLSPELAAFIGLEADATSELQWQVNVIPGLLQTERYAWHILSGFQGVRPARSQVIDRRVEARLMRRLILTREQEPLELTAILDESVLRRQRGDRSVMHEQLQHLVEISEEPNVTIRIISLAGPKGLALDSFTILQFGRAHDTPLHDVVSAESVLAYLYVEGEADTFEFRLAFDGLAHDALEPAESREFISKIDRQLWSLVLASQLMPKRPINIAGDTKWITPFLKEKTQIRADRTPAGTGGKARLAAAPVTASKLPCRTAPRSGSATVRHRPDRTSASRPAPGATSSAASGAAPLLAASKSRGSGPGADSPAQTHPVRHVGL